AVSGGASLPEDVMRTFEEKFGIEVLEGYGMTETASSCTFNRPGDRKVLSIGKPLWGVRMRVADEAGRPLPPGREHVGEILIRGRYNVYPREIEEVLYAHPAVLEAAVIGKPDERLGEEVVAVVALRPGMSATAEEIIAYTRERLAAYKYPREIRFLAELPKGA